MSSPRPIRVNQCNGKVRYVSFGEARNAMRKLIRYKGSDGWPMAPYHCELCRGFHFGHVPADQLKARDQAKEAKRV